MVFPDHFQAREDDILVMDIDLGFQILLEDDAILAVVKPAGLPTQAPQGIASLETRIKVYLASQGPTVSSPYLGIPHRLDRPVSGAMVFAKTPRSARRLSRQFEARRVKKTYWACVQGIVEPPQGVWTDYLWKVYGQPRAQVVDSAYPGARQAILRYRSLGTQRHGSWLEIELETGRTHQIRVQAASRGFPIVGDAHYGAQSSFGPRVDDERLAPIALHARLLAFLHPTTRIETCIQAPVGTLWDVLRTTATA